MGNFCCKTQKDLVIPKKTHEVSHIGKSISINDFSLLKLIGEGGSGRVFLVRQKNGENLYAMKVIRKTELESKTQCQNVISERIALEQVECPYLTRLRYAFQSTTRLYMLTDFYEGGDLRTHLQNGSFSEPQAAFYAAELAIALDYLHHQQITYRDLKPENILLDKDGHIRLVDMGLCKKIPLNESKWSSGGTPTYIAPEVILKKQFSYSVDWWALGIVLWELMTGKPPFEDYNINRLYDAILKQQLVKPSYMSIALLDRDPKTRLGSNGFLEVQQHIFFRGIDWELLKTKRCFSPSQSHTEEEDNAGLELTDLLSFSPTDRKSRTINAFRGFSYAQTSLE